LKRSWGPRAEALECLEAAEKRFPKDPSILREKIEADPREPAYIFTVRGVGYRFRDTA